MGITVLAGSAGIELSVTDLALILNGIDLATARRRTPPEWITLLFPIFYLAMISCSLS